jgi:hypothetical protein
MNSRADLLLTGQHYKRGCLVAILQEKDYYFNYLFERFLSIYSNQRQKTLLMSGFM